MKFMIVAGSMKVIASTAPTASTWVPLCYYSALLAVIRSTIIVKFCDSDRLYHSNNFFNHKSLYNSDSSFMVAASITSADCMPVKASILLEVLLAVLRKGVVSSNRIHNGSSS